MWVSRREHPAPVRICNLLPCLDALRGPFMILLISSGLDSPTVRLRHLGYLLLLFFSGLRFSRFASLRVVFVLGGAGGGGRR